MTSWRGEATDRQVIALVGDILYWCAKGAEDEIRREEGLRQVGSTEIDSDDARRRTKRRTLISYRVAKDAIEMVKE